MSVIWSKQALLSSGWAQDVAIEIDATGRIEKISIGAQPVGNQVEILLPAPVNAHSHAFQRAMAGMTERRGPGKSDSFWTWRQLMFRFLDQLTSDHIEAIAAFVQMEMLEAGYATNVEFHYLHHQPGGVPYSKLSEMCERVAAAADQSGIGLTLLPVHYQYGGCDKRDLTTGQVRFGNDFERFAKLHGEAADILKGLPLDTRLGVAPHSLRAVAPEDIAKAATLAGKGPIHLHLAEQVAEVEEVQNAWGARPVEWLLENLDVDSQWCLIHCTQMQSRETKALARSGAIAGLCPITESSLGDGIFDGVRWLDNGGKFAIGSDSNIRISLAEELRTLEYSQRLRDHTRAALASSERSTGRRIFEDAAKGGAQAAGRGTGTIAQGEWADLLALDGDHVDLIGRQGDAIIDSFIFAGGDFLVDQVWSAGRHMVVDGKHKKHDEICGRYRSVIGELVGKI